MTTNSHMTRLLQSLLAPTIIRRKLILIVVSLLVTAMLIVYAINASLTISKELRESQDELQLLADVTSHNLEATLLFHDDLGALEVLKSLRANPSVTLAEVSNNSGNVVARLTPVSSRNNAYRLLQVLPVKKYLSVERPIMIGERFLGAITIQSSLGEMWWMLSKQLAQLAAVVVGITLLGGIMMGRISRLIVEPIGQIASIAREITQAGNYSLRVPLRAKDEVGDMSMALNVMLAEIEHRDQALRIAAVAFESQEGMFVTNADGVILRANHSFTQITGYSPEQAIGQTPRILRSGRHDAEFYAAMWARIYDTGSWQGEIWNRRRNGEIYPEWLTITAVKDESGAITNYVATLLDITERKAAEDEIVKLAYYDQLTSLPNRRLLVDRLNQRLASGSRYNRNGALMFIDLDNFKKLNDTLGHDFGDMLLQQVANRLVSCVRESDTVARLGGDEFVVMLNDLSQNHYEAIFQAEAAGQKILEALNQPYSLAHIEYRSTPSIGATIFSDQNTSLDELMKQSDMAMYQAKKAGRNALRFFDPEIQSALEVKATMEKLLEQAVKEQQFELHYQMQVDNTGRILGAEVLLRWQHPDFGLMLPGEFIPLAEETGLIVPIGLWSLEQTCCQLKVWEADPAKQHLHLAVNVSARQFHQPDFIEELINILFRTGINPSKLKIELTESLAMDNMEETINKIQILKNIGVEFSMDDFGNGYSSLSNLKKLPVDQIKIDRNFIRDIDRNPDDDAIVQLIIDMANNLGIDVIAEGVETERQRDLLIQHQCFHFQGFLFSKPLPLDHFEKMLVQNQAQVWDNLQTLQS